MAAGTDSCLISWKQKLGINLRLELRGLNLRIPCLKAKEIFLKNHIVKIILQ